MENNEYYDAFEQRLTESLVEYCVSEGAIDSILMKIEELDEKWEEVAPEYMIDAIPNFNDYPTVAIAWAGYFGAAMASIWDTDWSKYSEVANIYKVISEPRTYDAMDEYIVEDILGLSLEGEEAQKMENTLRSCAQMTNSMMRKEAVQPMSSEAFYLFTRAVKVFFKLGVTIELKRLGYQYTLANSEYLN
ncbi:MAG: hypothetical protein R3Y26_07435 [Rikenellaceae bacterium]